MHAAFFLRGLDKVSHQLEQVIAHLVGGLVFVFFGVFLNLVEHFEMLFEFWVSCLSGEGLPLRRFLDAAEQFKCFFVHVLVQLEGRGLFLLLGF